MEQFFDSVLANLATEFVVVVVGVLIAHTLQKWWRERRYGGWRLVLRHDDGAVFLERALSAETAERLLHNEDDLDVYLKGRISPFANVDCDLIKELNDRPSTVINRDDAAKLITIWMRPAKFTLRHPPSRPMEKPTL